jgi:hypothetical protein
MRGDHSATGTRLFAFASRGPACLCKVLKSTCIAKSEYIGKDYLSIRSLEQIALSLRPAATS